jgi:transcriptional regulator with XRE-family HTH domain
MRNEITSPAQLNLLRLLRWHALDNRAAARLLGATEHTIGGWLAGKREPGAEYLILIARLFAVDPRDLHDDPRAFAARVADPARIAELDAKEWRRRGYALDEYGVAWRLAVRETA